jgi:hypothetical protein
VQTNVLCMFAFQRRKMIETEMTINKLEEPALEEWDELTIEMRRDLLALDLRISLFVGAVQNFKYGKF